MLRLAVLLAALVAGCGTESIAPPAPQPSEAARLARDIRDLWRQKRYAEAREKLDSELQRLPTAGTWLLLAETCLWLKDWSAVERALNGAQQAGAPGDRFLLLEARMRWSRRDYAGVRRSIDEMLEGHRASLTAATLAECGALLVGSHPSRALDLYQAALEADPKLMADSIDYWRSVGSCLTQTRQLDRAAATYEEALRRFPDDAWLQESAAHAYLWAGHVAKSQEWGRKAERILDVKTTHTVPIHPPFRGTWKVTQGNDGHLSHWGLRQKFAFDFMKVDESGEVARCANPTKLEDYYSWDEDVIAPAEGTVVVANDGIEDALGGANRPLRDNQVVIRHAPDLYSSVSHLRKGSIVVRVGDQVKQGDRIAKCGSSASPYPHIHFTLQSDPRTELCRPCSFTHAVDKEGRAVATPVTGDIVTHRE